MVVGAQGIRGFVLEASSASQHCGGAGGRGDSSGSQVTVEHMSALGIC